MEMTFIDPHPELFFSLLEPNSPYRHKVVPKRIQAGDGDILFIDSSHVVKTESDVVDYLFRILPALQPGVLVHIHDIFFSDWIHKCRRHLMEEKIPV